MWKIYFSLMSFLVVIGVSGSYLQAGPKKEKPVLKDGTQRLDCDDLFRIPALPDEKIGRLVSGNAWAMKNRGSTPHLKAVLLGTQPSDQTDGILTKLRHMVSVLGFYYSQVTSQEDVNKCMGDTKKWGRNNNPISAFQPAILGDVSDVDAENRLKGYPRLPVNPTEKDFNEFTRKLCLGLDQDVPYKEK